MYSKMVGEFFIFY